MVKTAHLVGDTRPRGPQNYKLIWRLLRSARRRQFITRADAFVLCDTTWQHDSLSSHPHTYFTRPNINITDRTSPIYPPLLLFPGHTLKSSDHTKLLNIKLHTHAGLIDLRHRHSNLFHLHVLPPDLVLSTAPRYRSRVHGPTPDTQCKQLSSNPLQDPGPK